MINLKLLQKLIDDMVSWKLKQQISEEKRGKNNGKGKRKNR